MKKTKLIVTIGESTKDKETLKKLILNGMNVARINFFNHTYNEIRQIAKEIRELDTLLNTNTAILANIRDSKIRTNNFYDRNTVLREGNYFSFLCGSEIIGDDTRCSISDSYLYQKVKINDILFLDNGLLKFKVEEILGREIKCKVLIGGLISKNSELNGTNIPFRRPFFTNEIISDIKLSCELGFDFVSTSCIYNYSDALKFKDKLIEYSKDNTRLICNIDDYNIIKNVDDILNICDGIIISRGELRITAPLEKIPSIQKDLIIKCTIKNKIAIVYSNILNSLEYNKIPSRVEISDVYNAIKYNPDALIISNPTAIGKYPVNACKILSEILEKNDETFDFSLSSKLLCNEEISDYDTLMSYLISQSCDKFPIRGIFVYTSTGKLANTLAKYKIKTPIISLTNNEVVARRLSLKFGIKSLLINTPINSDEFITTIKKVALCNGLVKKLDTIMIVSDDTNSPYKSNTLKILTV